VARDQEGNYSPPSANIAPALLVVGEPFTISDVHRNAAGDEVHFTAAGLASEDERLAIFWMGMGLEGFEGLPVFLGNGEHVLTGMDPHTEYNFAVVPQLACGSLPIYPMSFKSPAMPTAPGSPITNSPAQDLRELLTMGAIPIGIINQTLFLHQEPDAPDATITLYDLGGSGPASALDPSAPIFQPVVFVRVRGARRDFKGAYATAVAVRDALHGVHGTTLHGARYMEIAATGDIERLPVDENDRPFCVITFQITRTAA
jgi:hypothetical protein